MLAIKTALLGGGTLAGNGSAPETLVFDEIDAGIGGEVAVSVGDYLHKIAGLTQVFCITHLATIAVRADNHYKVEKASDGSRTNTGVTMLDAESRRQEIARMLSGDKGTAALAHADELLRRWGSLSKNASPHSELGFGVN
jgi:DNA repair protein RecN (Recombination protein N)